jgi:hypothetical protein
MILLVFVMGIYSTYETEHEAFGFLNLDNFTQDDVLLFHPFTCNQQISFFLLAK